MPPFQEVRAWMFEAALPFWAGTGVDRERGGFFEELDFAGQATDVAFKRTRVVCRQIYVFSHAAILGWSEGLALSALGYDYLVKTAWLGPDKGWARRLNADGSVLDPTPDLYDMAFVLFALSWRLRASGDRDALALMHATVDFIEAHMRHPNGIGFLHERPPTGFRQQNPHMHLLEACLAAFEASGEQRFLSLGGEIVDLFRTHLFDGATLAEWFNEDMRRAPGEEGRLFWPGHHFEWAWILADYQRHTRLDLAAEARALVRTGEELGVDPATHVTFHEVREDGVVLDRSSRAWSNAERIKGHLALFELGGHDPRPAVTGSARLLLDKYLDVSPRGSWIDHFDSQGRPLSKVAPTSTLYHVFLAFAEMLRLELKLTA